MDTLNPNLSPQEYVDVLRANPEKMSFPGAMLTRGGPKPYIGAMIAITGTLYFRNGYTEHRRSAIRECFTAYAELAHSQLRWLWRDEPLCGPPCQAYGESRSLEVLLGSLNENSTVNFQYSSGQNREDASPYTFYVNARPAWKAKKKPSVDVLRFSLPYLYVVEQPTVFQKLFVDFASRLQALHGHGGFGFVLSPSEWDVNEPTEAMLAPMAAGVDVGEPLFMSSMLRPNTMKSVSWLTAINKEMLGAIGGLPALRSELPSDWFALYDYGNGVVIQAGNEPDVVATSLDAKPPLYVLPNVLIKSFRSTEHMLHIAGSNFGEPRLHAIAGDAWMERFDIPRESLPYYKARLLAVPPLKTTHVLDRRL